MCGAGGQPGQGVLDLGGDGAVRHAAVGGVAPQVAHQAAERALAVDQEQRRHVLDGAVLRALRLDEEGVRPPRVHRILRRPQGRHPAADPGRASGIVDGMVSPAVDGRLRGEQGGERLRSRRPVLEAPLGEDRHVDAGDRLDAAARRPRP